MRAPGAEDSRTLIRKQLGRFGLDFVVAGVSFLNRQLDVTLEGVVGTTMSSTGFVTFLDLTTVTCAVSAPLTNKPNMLDMQVAPDPKEIRWSNGKLKMGTLWQKEILLGALTHQSLACFVPYLSLPAILQRMHQRGIANAERILWTFCSF